MFGARHRIQITGPFRRVPVQLASFDHPDEAATGALVTFAPRRAEYKYNQNRGRVLKIPGSLSRIQLYFNRLGSNLRTGGINEFFAGDRRILLGLRKTISTEMRRRPVSAGRQNAPDLCHEAIFVDRLAQDGANRLALDAGDIVGGEINDFELRPTHPRHARERDAVDPVGHDDVRDQQIDRPRALEVFESETVVGCEEDREAGGAQHSRGGLAKGRIVINHKDSRRRDRVPL
jgi:hypothetical protein